MPMGTSLRTIVETMGGGAPAGAPLTKGAKARLSLARHLADGPASEALLDEVCAELGIAVAAAAGGGGSEEGRKGEEEEKREVAAA